MLPRAVEPSNNTIAKQALMVKGKSKSVRTSTLGMQRRLHLTNSHDALLLNCRSAIDFSSIWPSPLPLMLAKYRILNLSLFLTHMPPPEPRGGLTPKGIGSGTFTPPPPRHVSRDQKSRDHLVNSRINSLSRSSSPTFYSLRTPSPLDRRNVYHHYHHQAQHWCLHQPRS